MGLIKFQRVLSEDDKRNARLWSLWLLYGKCPGKAEPDVDGYFDLQEIGEVKLASQRIDRWSPYSIAKGVNREEISTEIDL